MNDTTPSPPDPGSKAPGSVENPAPAPTVGTRKSFGCLCKYWWVPVLTLLLGLGVAAAFVLLQPPTFVSKARMWQTVKLHLPEGSFFAEDDQNFLGTQTELLQSAALRDLALARLRSSSTDVAVPAAKDGEPLPVRVRVTGSPKSSVFTIEATASQATYTQNYLDALMNVFIEYKRNIRRVVSGNTLASITAQVQRQEQLLKEQQDAFIAFQRSNNLVFLQQECPIAVACLAKLDTDLSDLQLEDLLLKRSEMSPAQTASHQTIQVKMEYIRNAIKEREVKVLEANSRLADAERLKLNVQREQGVYERLITLVQNVGISRNIEQETLAILEPASPAKRTYTSEKWLLAIATFGGLGLGFGIVMLPALYRTRGSEFLKSKPVLSQESIKPSPAQL